MPEPTAQDFAAAKEVLRSFLEASLRQDEPAMRAQLTQSTLANSQLDLASLPTGVRYAMADPVVNDGRLVIPVQAFAEDSPEDNAPVSRMPCVMALEEARWKVDLLASIELMFDGLGDAMGEAMGEMAGAMSEAMDGVGQALGEGFAGEAKEAQDWRNAGLTPLPDEFFPLAAMAPLPKTSASLSEAVGSPVLAQAAMTDIMRGMGADPEDPTICEWFENQLFAGWGAMFAEVAKRFPLKDRLRALRIEAAGQEEERLLAVDGSDLVYRMRLPQNSGFFQDDEIMQMLPGVLAQLPETIAPAVTGHRLLPAAHEYPDLDLYRERLAPRFMRRISEVVGCPVGLDIDWDELRTFNAAGQVLALWGLNRVLGGMALMFQEPASPDSLGDARPRVRIVFNSSVMRRYARCEGDTVEIGVSFYGGDPRGPYEYEIAQAMAGNPVE